MKQVLMLIVVIILLVGTVWPNGLNFFLPEKWGYEHWPLVLKIIGWSAVAVLFVLDSSAKAGGDDDRSGHE